MRDGAAPALPTLPQRSETAAAGGSFPPASPGRAVSFAPSQPSPSWLRTGSGSICCGAVPPQERRGLWARAALSAPQHPNPQRFCRKISSLRQFSSPSQFLGAALEGLPGPGARPRAGRRCLPRAVRDLVGGVSPSSSPFPRQGVPPPSPQGTPAPHQRLPCTPPPPDRSSSG